jgi:hypothetical protein
MHLDTWRGQMVNGLADAIFEALQSFDLLMDRYRAFVTGVTGVDASCRQLVATI